MGELYATKNEQRLCDWLHQWMIIIYDDGGWCLCSVVIGANGMECARQRYDL
jgi:hypothetical protein